MNVLDHFKKNEGIDFDYVSPFNEPQWEWKNKNQECQEREEFPDSNQIPLIHQILSQLELGS